MRVSERQRYDTVGQRIESAKDANKSMLEELSTQKRINVISDDPLGSPKSIRLKEKIGTIGQYQKNIDYSTGFLERSESAVQGLNDNLIRAKELAVAMANDTYDARSREASAREVREIIEEVVQVGNTSYNNRFVFAGFRNQTPPLSLDGKYLGDDGSIFLQTSDAKFQQINIQARHLFEATPEDAQKGHFNMLDTLTGLFHGLMDNDKDALYKMLDELDYQIEKTSSYQATIGGMWTSLNQTGRRLEKDDELSRAALSEIEDADIYKATSDFKRTETVLQSTLLASNKLLQPSLMNFLQ